MDASVKRNEQQGFLIAGVPYPLCPVLPPFPLPHIIPYPFWHLLRRLLLLHNPYFEVFRQSGTNLVALYSVLILLLSLILLKEASVFVKYYLSPMHECPKNVPFFIYPLPPKDDRFFNMGVWIFSLKKLKKFGPLHGVGQIFQKCWLNMNPSDFIFSKGAGNILRVRQNFKGLDACHL